MFGRSRTPRPFQKANSVPEAYFPFRFSPTSDSTGVSGYSPPPTPAPEAGAGASAAAVSSPARLLNGQWQGPAPANGRLPVHPETESHLRKLIAYQQEANEQERVKRQDEAQAAASTNTQLRARIAELESSHLEHESTALSDRQTVLQLRADAVASDQIAENMKKERQDGLQRSVLRKMRRGVLGAVFDVWCDMICAEAENKMRIKKVVLRIKNQTVAIAFCTWADQVSARRDEAEIEERNMINIENEKRLAENSATLQEHLKDLALLRCKTDELASVTHLLQRETTAKQALQAQVEGVEQALLDQNFQMIELRRSLAEKQTQFDQALAKKEQEKQPLRAELLLATKELDAACRAKAEQTVLVSELGQRLAVNDKEMGGVLRYAEQVRVETLRCESDLMKLKILASRAVQLRRENERNVTSPQVLLSETDALSPSLLAENDSLLELLAAPVADLMAEDEFGVLPGSGAEFELDVSSVGGPGTGGVGTRGVGEETDLSPPFGGRSSMRRKASDLSGVSAWKIRNAADNEGLDRLSLSDSALQRMPTMDRPDAPR